MTHVLICLLWSTRTRKVINGWPFWLGINQRLSFSLVQLSSFPTPMINNRSKWYQRSGHYVSLYTSFLSSRKKNGLNTESRESRVRHFGTYYFQSKISLFFNELMVPDICFFQLQIKDRDPVWRALDYDYSQLTTSPYTSMSITGTVVSMEGKIIILGFALPLSLWWSISLRIRLVGNQPVTLVG